MNAPSHASLVCPYRRLIVWAVTVWRECAGGWRQETRSCTLTAREARSMARELERLADELEVMERERVTRADVQVRKAA